MTNVGLEYTATSHGKFGAPSLLANSAGGVASFGVAIGLEALTKHPATAAMEIASHLAIDSTGIAYERTVTFIEAYRQGNSGTAP